MRRQSLVSPSSLSVPRSPSLAGQETNDPEHGEDQHSQNENTKVECQEDDTQIPNAHLQNGGAKMKSAECVKVDFCSTGKKLEVPQNTECSGRSVRIPMSLVLS